jgi:hypothetical protein
MTIRALLRPKVMALLPPPPLCTWLMINNNRTTDTASTIIMGNICINQPGFVGALVSNIMSSFWE